MKARVRLHVYRPDPTLPADHRGGRVCAQCGLPRGNAAHKDAPEDDVSARQIGEGANE